MQYSESPSSSQTLVAGNPLLDVRNLNIQVATPTGPKLVVKDMSFQLHPSETLCIAGESGSGKSLTSLSLMGLLAPSVRVCGGQAIFADQDIYKLTAKQLRKFRGAEIAMIFQEPMTSLNPVMKIGQQLAEPIALHRQLSGQALEAEILRLLDAVRISDAKQRLDQYPHELSGGMRQRIMIGMALSCKPKLLIADEPTTALDVTIQAQILALMNELKHDFDTSIILITHDMGVVAETADRVVVMNQGSIVEQNDVVSLFKNPAQDYTKSLLSAVPKLGSGKAEKPKPSIDQSNENPVLEINDLVVRFPIKGGLLQRTVKRVHAVESVSFSIKPGETFSLVGESGCGKSTIGKAILNLIPWSGSIKLNGHETSGLSKTAMFPIRRQAQMVFQDPYASLNARMTAGQLVAEPMLIHQLYDASEIQRRTADLFDKVGLPSVAMDRYPHEFSGGQRQRICIARALALSPKLIIADESVSALDVSVQAQVLTLLNDLQAELGLSYLFISHDMAVVEQISDRVALMYEGQIVEMGKSESIFANPQHSYTKRLLSAVPIPDPTRQKPSRDLLVSEISSPIKPLDYQPQHHQYKTLNTEHVFAKT